MYELFSSSWYCSRGPNISYNLLELQKTWKLLCWLKLQLSSFYHMTEKRIVRQVMRMRVEGRIGCGQTWDKLENKIENQLEEGGNNDEKNRTCGVRYGWKEVNSMTDWAKNWSSYSQFKSANTRQYVFLWKNQYVKSHMNGSHLHDVSKCGIYKDFMHRFLNSCIIKNFTGCSQRADAIFYIDIT